MVILMLFDELVSENQNSIDKNDTKTDFVISKADKVLVESDKLTVAVKHYQGRNIVAVDRRSEVGFTVVLNDTDLKRFKQEIL